MLRKSLRLCGALTMLLVAQFAQAADPTPRPDDAPREAGWDIGFTGNYQLSQNLAFDGGTSLDIEDSFGLGLTYGYRFSSRFELQFAVDWMAFDYLAHVQSSVTPGKVAHVPGDLHSLTPRLTGVFNLLKGPLTPYVSAGVGWSFIASDISDQTTDLGCWWDPWFGQICAPYGKTKNLDAFRYHIGVGARWDFHRHYSARLAYEKQWMDTDHSNGALDFDQFRLGLEIRY